MRQVVQDQGEGTVSVIDVPAPLLQPYGVLIETSASVISSGTERSKVAMGEKSLVAKARARPDLAKKVLEQARKDGIRATVDLVKDRLGTPQPLGYSAAGVVQRVGTSASGFEPGQLVAVGGAGFANHAEVNYVPSTLAAVVPEGVSADSAAFATLGAIAMHGIRQASLSAGELVAVSGLGLIGQLAVRLLRAYGHPVVGIDPSLAAREEVSVLGVEVRDPDDSALTRLGADAVLLTAATSSDEPIQAAPQWCRDRARVVVVGDVGLSLNRPPYYDGEVDLRFSRSYGPGRYDPGYEELGRDYPIGYVRWTEGRNLQEFLRLLGEGLLDVSDLIDARYAVTAAPAAYERLAHGGRARAILLEYPAHEARVPVAPASQPARRAVGRQDGEKLRISACGAGNFARRTLFPAFESTGLVSWAYVSTSSGLTATHVAKQRGFVGGAVATAAEALMQPDVDAAIIATRHDTHAELAQIAASRDLPVYIEKPLAVTPEELNQLLDVSGSSFLTTGFNRRGAAPVQAAMPALRTRREPGMVQIRVNAGRLPPGHWADAAEQGGRIVGEVCHFVDLACYLLDSPVTRVIALSAGGRPPQMQDTLQILMGHGDGSASTIAYVANGSPLVNKERIEVHWDGKSLLIEDFRSWQLTVGGSLKRGRIRRQDKGHASLVASFVAFARGNAANPVPIHQAAHVTRVTFAIVESLAAGGWTSLDSAPW